MSAYVRIPRLAEWPASDREMWQRAIQQGGLFDDLGPLSHLATPTLGMIQAGYGKWLGWLTETQPEILALPPARRLELERFVIFIKAHAHLSPKTRHLYAANTLRLLCHCHPDREWGPFRRVLMHLERQAEDHVSRRKDGRILSGNYVLAKALELEGPAAAAASTPLQKALLQRNGTLIAFLTLIPIRRRALTSLRIDESVVFDGDDILIVTTPEMNKTKTYWETLVAPSITPVLRRYIHETRPRLMAGRGIDHTFLWVTKDGDPISGTAMGTLIRNQTRELFGVPISAHLFRDIAATTLARTSPEAVGHIRAPLSLRGHETAEKYYNHATAVEVGRNHARPSTASGKETDYACRDLCPLFFDHAAGGVDRGPGAPLRGTRRARGMVGGSDVQRHGALRCVAAAPRPADPARRR